MVEMEIYGVSFDIVGKMPIVLLKTADGSRYLPIWIGHPEAAAILIRLQNSTTPRPMTHDLFVDMLSQLDVRVVRITVTELRENTFYAAITIAQDGQEIEIDSRPSDAIALAIRTEAPIFADERLIDENGIEFEPEDGEEGVPGEPVSLTQEQIEEMTSKFKSFLPAGVDERVAVLLLVPPHLTGDGEPVQERSQDLPVRLVDLRAQARERLVVCVRAHRGRV
jgi:bifunctional DNase/RNase